ncbi:hypothetical protein EXS62_02555 [Candidatus Kaiserbacteria bacterium]|nr:hypothetical protein [Candidatus Kaiserbacteria bacterium]
MATTFRPRTLVLFLGDLLSLILALWVSLFLRAFEAPLWEVFLSHLAPFSLLFVVWVGVFFIAGLYENRSVILARRALSTTLLVAQTFNIAIAALFFFFIPLFGIAPKTILFIYLAVSFVLILLWRVLLAPRLWSPEPAVAVGAGVEVSELARALNAAHRAPARIVAVIDPNVDDLAGELRASVARYRVRMVIADWDDPRVSAVFGDIGSYIAEGVRFFDATTLYEAMFGRIALRRVDNRWVARHVSRYAHTLYDVLKRVMDIVVALPAGILSLIAYPFIAIAIKLEDGGPVFIAQERVGQDSKIIRLPKFRSMSRNEQNLLAEQSDNKVTAVGRILRLTRLDELPQLWSVVRGDLSLIGPRPELPSGVALYTQKIPYYNTRHLIKPGLSGWAQLYHDNHPHHGAEVEATREKLSYDLFYLTHRSLVLDATIALKTIKKLLTRSGV